MTEERLRTFLSTGSRSPAAGSPFRVGIELEFIVHREGKPDDLLRRTDFSRLMATLEGAPRFRASLDAEGAPRASRDQGAGYLCIKPDFAFHIVELAFPPCASPKALEEDLHAGLTLLDQCLGEIGFMRSRASQTSLPDDGYDLVAPLRLQPHLEALRRRHPNDALLHHFPATLAATHVHLSVPHEIGLPLLPRLYSRERLAARLFTRCHSFEEGQVRNARALLYDKALGRDYILANVPDPLPASVADLAALYNRCPRLFEGDAFFAARDMSNIRPKPFGTLEFRSACSMPSVDDILDVVAFRIAQLAFSRAAPMPLREGQWPARSFRDEFLADASRPVLEATWSPDDEAELMALAAAGDPRGLDADWVRFSHQRLPHVGARRRAA